jgi:rRNA maturation endonuclease Nob1
MKVKLGVLERINLMNILPIEGDVLTLKVMQEAKNKLAFTEAELKKFEIRKTQINPGQININWNHKKDIGDSIELSETVCQIIKEKLIKLNTEKKLTEHFLPLYEKFVEK